MKKIFTISIFFLSIKAYTQPAGSLDPTFGTGGKVITSITNGSDKANGVVIQTDGKILVAGNSSSSVTGKDFVCVRYNSDGSLDNTFGNSGITTTDIQLGSDDVANSISIQPDGKIVLAGYTNNGSDKNAAIVRYKIDGTPDSTFGTNGIVITDFDNSQSDEIRVVKIHSLSGKIIVGGSTQINTTHAKPVVARYLSNGTIDSTFNTTGIRLLWITALDYQYLFSLEDLIVQSNGKISAIGWRDFPTLAYDDDYWACRINSDGSMDNTFSTDGVNTYNGSFNGSDNGYSMLLKPNNNFIGVGGGAINSIYTDFTLFELNSDGTSGSVSNSTDFGALSEDIAYGLAEDINGKFVSGGSAGSSTARSFAITRVSPGGSNDNSFDSDGKTTTTFGANAMNECFEIAIQSDNKIIAVGYTGNDFAIARYLGDAVPDLNNFQLQSPANAAVNQNYSNLVFNWTDAFGATGYELEIDTTATFTGTPQTYNTVTSAKKLTNLFSNTQYFWRVRATDGTNWGQQTAAWSFITNTLENFNLILPANNATNQNTATLNYDWSDAVGALSYEIEIDLNQTFTNSPQTFNSATSSYSQNSLQQLTDYYWHVRATDGNSFGQWSNTWKFTTGNATSIADKIAADEIKIYPNPASDFIQLEVENNFIGKHYQITDVTGKEILSGKIVDIETIVPLKQLATGTYFFQIGELIRLTFKIIKE